MGTTLTGTTPQDTYDSLIKVTDNGPLTGSLKRITDGLGNDSALSLSTGAARITGNLTVKTTTERANITTDVDLVTENGIGILSTSTSYGQGYQYVRFFNSSAAYAGSISQISATGIGLYSGASADLILGANSTERLRITSAGNVGIGVSDPNGTLTIKNSTTNTRLEFATEGAGVSILGYDRNALAYKEIYLRGSVIQFNPNDSNRVTVTPDGLTFNGDTAAANALDDYEEGTFTPTTAGDATGAFSGVLGEYTKIGNVVHFRIAATISTNFTSFDIGGLPFTIGGGGSPSGVVGLISIANTGSAALVGFTSSGTTAIRLCSDNNITNTTAPTTTMGTLRMFGTYRV